ncbi:16S rRNA pseudouridylate synthase [Levilactobacillus yonginensis]|uniref:16S rRNA pseudouridylate synthase n=1 Tax=Levilactobacillus yonginensis TaxID=1054041 RepID=UPI000F770CFA|nr:16S rRNA pseudouridylate synthase [Levilactobacillus yonginensis]
MNIERYLTEHRQGTPGQIFRLLRQGRVTVNDVVVDSPRRPVMTQDDVRVDNLAVAGRQPQYYVFNKPMGFQLSMDPTVPRSLGSLLNGFDQQWQLESLADLPREAVGAVIASDDVQFLTDVVAQNWSSTCRVQLTGVVAPEITANTAFQKLTTQVDQASQTTTVSLETTDLAAAVATLSQLPGVTGPVERTALGPLGCPVDLAIGTYRGLTAIEIDSLLGEGIPAK